MSKAPLTGLIAAMPTPMRADRSLNLKPIEALANHALKSRLSAVYIGSAAGECSSLTLEERQRLAAWWAEILRGIPLRLVVHVGHNCLADARQLAMHAEKIGADAIGAISPAFIKPNSVERLVACCEAMAAAAPRLPFYFHDEPEWTGVRLSLSDILALGRKRIPTLAGLVYGSHDLVPFQECLCRAQDRLQVLFAREEMLVAGLALGGRVGLGTTLAVAGPIYKRLFDDFIHGDLSSARVEQARAVELISTCRHYGFHAAAKAVMKMVGIDCGPPRLPLAPLSPSQIDSLHNDLDRLEFFDWIGPYHAHARKPIPRVQGGILPLPLSA